MATIKSTNWHINIDCSAKNSKSVGVCSTTFTGTFNMTPWGAAYLDNAVILPDEIQNRERIADLLALQWLCFSRSISSLARHHRLGDWRGESRIEKAVRADGGMV
jgi:hypothetical protein